MAHEGFCRNGGSENGEGGGEGEAEFIEVWTLREQEREIKEEESEGDKPLIDLEQSRKCREMELEMGDSSKPKRPDVHWERVSKLTEDYPNDNINYTEIIKQERLSAAFQNQPEQSTFFAGGLYAKLPEGGNLRSVYCAEQSNPTRPIMQAAVDEVDNGIAIQYYPWDRVNFVFLEMGQGTYKCYIYTPANRGSYGLVVDEEEEVYFKPTTQSDPSKDFTLFHIELLSDITVIKVHKSDKVENSNFGLYVDANDGKVKATAERENWTSFKITKFLPQDNPVSENSGRRMRMNCTKFLPQDNPVSENRRRRMRMICCVPI